MDLQLIIVLVIVVVVAVAVFGQLKGSRPSYEVLNVDQLAAQQQFKDDKKKEKAEKKTEQFHWDQAEKKEKKSDKLADKKKKKKEKAFDPVAAGQSMVVKPTNEEKKGIEVTMIDRKAKARSEKAGFVTVETKAKRTPSKEADEFEADATVTKEVEVVDARVEMLRQIIAGRKPDAPKDGSPTGGGYKGRNPRKEKEEDAEKEGEEGENKDKKKESKKISAIEKAILDNRNAKAEKKVCAIIIFFSFTTRK